MFRRIAFAILILLITPFILYAQEPDSATKTFITEDGLLSFEYPADWSAEGRLYPFMNTVVIANQEEILPMVTDQYLLPGQAEIMVQVFALADFEQFGLNEAMSAHDMLTIVLKQIGTENVTIELGDFQHPEYDSVSAYAFVAQENFSIYGVWMLPGDGTLRQVGLFAHGEEAQLYKETVDKIALSLEFTGTVEDIRVQTGHQDMSEAEQSELTTLMTEMVANDTHNRQIIAQSPLEYVESQSPFQSTCGTLSFEYPSSWRIVTGDNIVFVTNSPVTSSAGDVQNYISVALGTNTFTEDELDREYVEIEDRLDVMQVTQAVLSHVLAQGSKLITTPFPLGNGMAFIVNVDINSGESHPAEFIVLPETAQCMAEVYVIDFGSGFEQYQDIILHIVESIEFTETEDK